MQRRNFLKIGSLSTLAWLSSRAMALAEEQSAKTNRKATAKSIIVLWLDGGPSQLETFDPHEGETIGGPTKAIRTSVKDAAIAASLPQVAEQLQNISLLRSMVTKEGDHDRGRYLMRTGFRPSPTVIHPALGSICAASLKAGSLEIPPYVSILSDNKFSRGGFLGEEFDAYPVGDPSEPPANLQHPLGRERLRCRLDGLNVVESSFAGRNSKFAQRTLHDEHIHRALKMMDSSQIEAFNVAKESISLQAAYGHTPFGRGCLAARRLVEQGVRCVEVQLGGWDTHVSNFEGCKTQAKILDPAFATLLKDLKQRELLDSTIVLCGGEFGRTPKINPTNGRDHWTNGFSIAIGGGGVRPGMVIGKTDPAGVKAPTEPISAEDLFATILTALGIDPTIEHLAGLGRPIKLSDGKPIKNLLAI